ncbi:hypothetical protein O8C79_07070 [Aliarcobacter butzleri]|uniref:hypothetical protein n=1 Tax=Aliarcobacter butzleri TaxID=28197 RepID=UPI00263E9642|nr:hypothetical protein [Aliarcobacter butzleri]MDN5105045.1 hypothetical protein [Aliarcobacter butzleri]
MKNKQLSYKKREQRKKQNIKAFREFVKKYSLTEWLEKIREINLDNETYELNAQLSTKAEFLVPASDIVIRLSKQFEDSETPTLSECMKLNSAEIEFPKNPPRAIKIFGISGIPFLASWQNRFYYNKTNIIGRMHELYKKYSMELLSNIGLSINDIYLILLSITAYYDNKEILYFKKEDISHELIPEITSDKVSKFLANFSITQDEYIRKAKTDKVYENDFGKFKYLVRYPIIKVDDRYIIPVFEQLFDTLSNNLYFILLENYRNISENESKKFLDEFGLVLENYVLDLARIPFGKTNVIDANTIVTEKKELRCETVITHNNCSLAIEVKKMYFKRDDLFNMDKESIDRILSGHLVKAYKQIENTFRYLNTEESFGLIVIPDILIGFDMISDYLKKQFNGEANFDDRIQICTLSTYESLMANNKDNVFKIIKEQHKLDRKEGRDLILYIEKLKNIDNTILIKNSFLENNTREILNFLLPVPKNSN